MRSILKQIIKQKRLEVKKAKISMPLKKLKDKIRNSDLKIRDFRKSITVRSKIGLIGELKKASPSKGYLNRKLDLAKTAVMYEKAGVSAISVLTDRHFCGKLKDLNSVKKAVDLPLLRKDFFIDEYQVYESVLAGADAVLLIASVLTAKKLSRMIDLVHSLGMNALIEIHDLDDIKKIDMKKARIIGINNRDLNTFNVSLETTKNLVKKIPCSKTIVSESGIFSRQDMLFLKKLKVNCVLVGESIVTAKKPDLQIRRLLGKK
jgi:indole-3-glycerol phosphate synthase